MHQNQACRQCGVTETPEWRRGPDGSHTLCNACGLRFSKQMRKRGEEELAALEAAQVPQALPSEGPSTQQTVSSTSSLHATANEHNLELPVPEDVLLSSDIPPTGTNA